MFLRGVHKLGQQRALRADVLALFTLLANALPMALGKLLHTLADDLRHRHLLLQRPFSAAPRAGWAARRRRGQGWK